MKASYQIAVLVLAALVAATPYNYPPAPTIIVNLGNTDSISALSAVLITSTPEVRSTTSTDSSGDYITIAMTNVYGNQLSLSFSSNTSYPSPVGNPSATTLPNNTFTQYTFLTR